MISKTKAKQLATEYINSGYQIDGDEPVVVDEETIEKDYGWIFFYTSRRYLETGNISDMLAGNGPVLVRKDDGSIRQFGSALPVEEYIKRYEALLD